MTSLFSQVGAGFVGGLTRAIVGIVKSQQASAPGTFQLNWKYVFFTLLTSCFVGAVAGVVLDSDWHLGILAGYAGSDFLENIYKMKFQQTPDTTNS